MLTGRNHHSVGMGAITEMATSAPGNNSIRPKEKAPIAETLKLNGYSTAQFGKCHEVPAWEVTPAGPFHQWPTGSGFEYFYGFIGGEANQYYPGLYEGTTAVEPPKSPEEGYTLTEDLADRAITWVRQQKALMPDKPFFMYFAPGRHPRPAPRAQGMVGQVQGQVRRRLGRAAGEDIQAAEEARRDPEGRRADQAARRDPGLGRYAGRAASRCWRVRWRSTPASWSRPTTRSVGVVDAHRRPRRARRHAGLLHHRRQRRVGGGHAQRLLQRDDDAQRHARASRRRSSCCPRSTTSARPTPTTTTPSAGRTRCARRTSGPSRWRRTGAAPATARSCTGRTG